ncbi:MAG: Smr/MutS family protein [Thermodesulfobacteriota bacterium]
MDSKKKRYRLIQGQDPAAKPAVDAREPSFSEQMVHWREDLSASEILAHKGLPLPRSTGEKCRRVSPLATLDLHGRTTVDLAVLVDGFLYTQARLGNEWVRIITGKGLHSAGPPVLRDGVDQLLRAMHFSGKIASFRWEGGSIDNSGAVFVRLRNGRCRR